AAFSNPVESVAGSHYPRIRAGTLQVFSEVFEDGRVGWGDGGKVVKSLVHPSDQAGGGDIMAEDSPVDHLSEEGRLRDEFAHKVRDVFLPLRCKRLLVARAAAKGDHHYFSLLASGRRSGHRARTQQRASQRQPGGIA